jgi:lysyl-tRNA synthetase class 1
LFEIAKKHSLAAQEFFRVIYQILFQSNQGPKLGPYIIDRGKNEIIEKLREVL